MLKMGKGRPGKSNGAKMKTTVTEQQLSKKMKKIDI